MMKPKVIKSEEEYQAALAHLESLMDAVPGSAQETELELFAILIEKYEEENYPIELPDPIEAIKFHMEQQGLSKKDLVQYIGSQSKVSEVLNRKRPLSLAMIRALHVGLGIPAEILLQEPSRSLTEPQFQAKDFPFAEMFHRGYFSSSIESLREARLYAEELLEHFFTVFANRPPQQVLCRNSGSQLDEKALMAWQARVLHLVDEEEFPPYHLEQLTHDFIYSLVKLSKNPTGPNQAKQALRRIGVPLVILQHLPRTYLDGACFKTVSGRPIVGLTLRYDRLDNFWFTLVHELSHIHLHLGSADLAFFDDTEHGAHRSCSPQEQEANQLTASLLIPDDIWQREKTNLIGPVNSNQVVRLAEQLDISPAIVAGRIRWETEDYTRYDALIGRGLVSPSFTQDNKPL